MAVPFKLSVSGFFKNPGRPIALLLVGSASAGAVYSLVIGREGSSFASYISPLLAAFAFLSGVTSLWSP